MNEVQCEALRQLRRVVENAPEEFFHMRAVVEEAECGTARCALGWALVDPWFLHNTELAKLAGYNDRQFVLDAEKIVSNVFSLDSKDQDNLFGSRLAFDSDPHGVSKEEVIANIDALLAGERTKPYRIIGDDI